MKIHKNSKILKLFFPKWVTAFTFGSHVFTRSKNPSAALIKHETVHVKQYKQYGIIKFLWIYFWVDRKLPYRQKRFEKEAYKISDPSKDK